MIFSAVYGQDHRGPLFFDRGPNMLNVAASRARDAFLVFGAMGLFRKENGTRPSAVLARHLFADPANEVTDVEPPAALLLPPRGVTFQRIATLEEHRALLREAIETVRKRLLVVSPYLSRHALEADGLIPLLREAVARGVEVTVVNDGRLNADERGRLRPAAAEARAQLIDAGVRLLTVDGIHTKTLAVDEAWIVEGSFNWLSAARDRGSKWYRAEASLLYRGTEAAAMVDAARRAIGGLRVMAEVDHQRSERRDHHQSDPPRLLLEGSPSSHTMGDSE